MIVCCPWAMETALWKKQIMIILGSYIVPYHIPSSLSKRLIFVCLSQQDKQRTMILIYVAPSNVLQGAKT